MTQTNVSEDVLQAQCFQWCWNCRIATRRLIWHVPNGGDRRIVQAKQLQAMGVVPGVSDMHFFWNGRLYIIEMKVGSNILSDSQKEYRDAMKAQGAIFYECRTFDKWKAIIDGVLNGSPLPGE